VHSAGLKLAMATPAWQGDGPSEAGGPGESHLQGLPQSDRRRLGEDLTCRAVVAAARLEDAEEDQLRGACPHVAVHPVQDRVHAGPTPGIACGGVLRSTVTSPRTRNSKAAEIQPVCNTAHDNNLPQYA